MSEHRYDIRISESCVDPNLLMVERQDQDILPVSRRGKGAHMSLSTHTCIWFKRLPVTLKYIFSFVNVFISSTCILYYAMTNKIIYYYVR